MAAPGTPSASTTERERTAGDPHARETRKSPSEPVMEEAAPFTNVCGRRADRSEQKASNSCG